ncbi:Membrane carboxypeptidase (penicillin-binding protein) [Amycolatopsis tolypomycina]|uniref:Membrane carboxypeptidase (Penicillin-binding protein) n=1 Tax=Amycolatopsis tolypomycina TaxID=208445 RepID=A0A1H4J0R2_9PSEU|nr:transglycosylase domain-containing protein [Amycolatopsis tolypomycina]SEB39894.1 Membrane carboxypeptidase (penicillin-binding protein) [Amycolatopsis tolypomycina]
MTDDNRSWPNQEPDAPRRAQWPGEDAGPAWPGESPRRATPPRGNPRQGGPAWPAGDEGGRQWPGDQPRRPQGQAGAPGRRQPPPPGGRRPGGPPGSPPQGFRQPPPAGRRPEPEPEREPDLITHHAHNGTEDAYDDDRRFDEFADDVEPQQELDEKGRKVLTPAQKKKRRWKIIRRVAYACVGVFFVVPAIAFVITYFMVDVPTPESVAALQSQPITYYYADNSVMGKSTKGGDRQLLKPGEIPDVVKHAVYSAEDATFETNSGFDFTGILRAVFNQATGGQGGGSTISQQYIKQATQNDAPTLTRKWTELAKSFKMNNQESKEEIITGYLNIVYFGRGANGIQAAAKAYFNKDTKDLSASEASLLAGLIQGPGRSENQDYIHRRWTYVMDQMVANKWLRADERASAQFPTPVPKASKDSGQTMPYHIQQRIDDELAAEGYDNAKLHASGAKVYTTIDPKAQKAAEEAVAEKMKGQTDDRLLSALVAVSPKTGGVLAYYGGPDIVKNAEGKDQTGQDRANQARNPGSSFKAFDLTAYLKMGKGLGDTFDGQNNRKFGNPPRTIRNAGESSSCGPECTVAEAMEISANTVFYDMVYNITKPARVAQAANEAGVPTSPQMSQDINIALGGGATVATPEAMAAGYATFAGDGMQRQAHFVAKLTNAQDEVEFDESKYQAKPAFDSDAQKTAQIAGNVTTALGPVIPHSKLECPTGHQCAGKTGTQQYDPRDGDPAAYRDRNAQTWMVGYTPSVSAAAWVGGDGNIPLHDNKNKPIFGSTIAGPMWEAFMQKYLEGTPGEKFDKVDPIGKDANDVTTTQSKPSNTPTPSDTPTSTPTEPSSETPTESETETSTSRTRTPRPGPGGSTIPLPGGDGNGFARPPGSEDG